MRATRQWFTDLHDIKADAISALDDVTMVPEIGRTRLKAMLSTRNDWCISRQRAWGVPIPVLYDAETDEHLLTRESFAHIRALVEKYGTDCWWSLPTEELLAPQYRNNGKTYRRGMDILDVWFDSGSSWKAVVDAREGRNRRSDIYLEGSDQHRGWFQSSLLTKIAATQEGEAPTAPFKTVVTHGFVLDEQGRKMSKSLGNGIDPDAIINGAGKASPAYGADVLRWWVASSDFTEGKPQGYFQFQFSYRF